jgi:hypothetical protein
MLKPVKSDTLPLPAQDSDLSEGWSLALSDTESLGIDPQPKSASCGKVAEAIMTALMTSFIMNQAESMAIANQSSIFKLFP